MSTSEALQPYVDHLSETPPQFLGQANAVRFALLPLGAGIGYVGLMLYKPRPSAFVRGHLIGTGDATRFDPQQPDPNPWCVRISIAMGPHDAVDAGVSFCALSQESLWAGAVLHSFESDVIGSDPFELQAGDLTYSLQLRRTTVLG
jgi:hypothetical protein